MDFLTLFSIYVLLVLSCMVLICKSSGEQQRNHFSSGFNFIVKVFSPVTPKWLQRFSQRTFHRLFHQRNSLFIYLHVLLEAAVYVEFSYEVFGYCREMETSLTSLAVPYLLLVIKTVFFILCINSDPGTVSQENLSGHLLLYPYDRKLFHPDVSCPSCDLVKPARSKHCRVCDRCVQRFDHHCVWVNNCIGANNTRYFLFYLLSVCCMAADITLLTSDMLLHLVLRTGLLRARYIDQEGMEQQAGPLFVVQHLFLTFPRIIFMLGFLVFLFFLLAGYTLFHCCLAVFNQTSNEWYKSRGFSCQHCQQSAAGPDRTGPHQPCDPGPDRSRRFFYSRGLLRNVAEILCPPQPVHTKTRLTGLMSCVFMLRSLALLQGIKFISVISVLTGVCSLLLLTSKAAELVITNC